MIQVALPSPPVNYESEVNIPGKAFLRNTSDPTKRDWKNHRYWYRIHDYLYNEHNGICLYCASWTPRRQQSNAFDHTSIDHFIPKTSNAQLAYEWSNFRLCRSRLNNYKSDFQDVLDPCLVSNYWFYLDFTSFLIKSSPHVADISLKQDIIGTINRLRLNTDNDYVNERIQAIREYSSNNLSLNILKEKFPFIADQMRIQNFDQNYKDRLRQLFQRINFI
jgi:hypothetical protein